jgi:hypothetical protein
MKPDPTAVAVRFAKKWKKLPPGWTDKSVEKFWKTLGKGTPEHKVWNCIEKMDKPFGDGAGAFCGGLADWQMPGWRQKNKKESPDARSDAKSYWKGKIKNKKAQGETPMIKASATRVALKKAGAYRISDKAKKLDSRGGYSLWEDGNKWVITDRSGRAYLEPFGLRRDADKAWGMLKAKSAGLRRRSRTASAASVALRFAVRNAPPSMTGSAALLKKQGLTPVDVWFGEAKPHRRPILDLNDTVQTRRGDLMYFAGVASDGSAILGKTEQEAKRLNKQVIEDRKHHSTRAASTLTAASGSSLNDVMQGWLQDLIDVISSEVFTANGVMWHGRRGTAAGAVFIEGELNDSGTPDDCDCDVRVECTLVKGRGVKATVKVWNSEDSERWDNTFDLDTDSKDIVRAVEKAFGRITQGIQSQYRTAQGSPLMLQPDYGHGDAAVPGDEEYHPCQHGGPCQCGGQCSCGK